MVLSLQFVLALIVYLCPCVADEVSKACYGTPGTLCVNHTLTCNSGRIAIKQAFFTGSTVCGIGISYCDNVSFSSIPLNVTRYNFSDTELDPLCGNCSTQSTCSLPAPRSQRGFQTFSAIIYQCINGTQEVCILANTTTTQNTKELPSTDISTGPIAGGVIAVLSVCSIVAAVLIWFKFVRNKKEDQRPERGSTNHAHAASTSSTATEHRGSRKTTSNYDYATIHMIDNPVERVQNHYVLAGKPSTENGTTVFMEDDYNHINHNPPQGASSLGYDTSASAAAAVKKLKNASSNSIEDEDYNHLGDGKPSVVSSDYDTTVSASKAVAQLGDMKESEDDYDHFERSEDRVIDSPYDTANHHSIVSTDAAPSPYGLAK